MPLIRIPVTEDTDHELPAIERGLLRLWHNDQIALCLEMVKGEA